MAFLVSCLFSASSRMDCACCRHLSPRTGMPDLSDHNSSFLYSVFWFHLLEATTVLTVKFHTFVFFTEKSGIINCDVGLKSKLYQKTLLYLRNFNSLWKEKTQDYQKVPSFVGKNSRKDQKIHSETSRDQKQKSTIANGQLLY